MSSAKSANGNNIHNASMSLELLSDPNKGTTIRASSTLQKNTKLYGPMHLLSVSSSSNINNSRSWNSGGNSDSETLILNFGRPVIPKKIDCQFQAGFSAAQCLIMYGEDATITIDLEMEDVHTVQTFDLNQQEPQEKGTAVTRELKLVLTNLTDFYGRVIVYKLHVWGWEKTD